MVVVPSIAAALGIVLLEGQGALAASFYVSGIPFTITATEMDGTGFNQYGGIDIAQANPDPSVNIKPAYPVAVTGITDATIHNLCQSIVLPGLPFIGQAAMVIHAGADPKPVTAHNLYIDMQTMQGDAVFTNIDVGIDASDPSHHFNKGPKPAYAPQNMFGQQADSLVIKNLKQTALSTSAGTFSLNGMDLRLYSGKADVDANVCK